VLAAEIKKNNNKLIRFQALAYKVSGQQELLCGYTLWFFKWCLCVKQQSSLLVPLTYNVHSKQRVCQWVRKVQN